MKSEKSENKSSKKSQCISQQKMVNIQKTKLGSLFEAEAQITMLALTKKSPDGCQRITETLFEQARHTFLHEFQESLEQSIQDVSKENLTPLKKSIQLDLHQEQRVGLMRILQENRQTKTMKGEIDLVYKIPKYGEFLSSIPQNLDEYNQEQRNPYEFWFCEDILGLKLKIPQQNVNLVCEAKRNFWEKENKEKYCHNVIQLIRIAFFAEIEFNYETFCNQHFKREYVSTYLRLKKSQQAKKTFLDEKFVNRVFDSSKTSKPIVMILIVNKNETEEEFMKSWQNHPYSASLLKKFFERMQVTLHVVGIMSRETVQWKRGFEMESKERKKLMEEMEQRIKAQETEMKQSFKAEMERRQTETRQRLDEAEKQKKQMEQRFTAEMQSLKEEMQKQSQMISELMRASKQSGAKD